MYRSLLNTQCDFKMYVLAMDEKCKSIIDDYCYKNVITISIMDFVDHMGLGQIRNTRSRAEFCWTCTSCLIYYILTHYNEPICTYVDSDLYFYQDPSCLIDEMGEKTVQIVEHRFDNSYTGKMGKATSGTYCVEFNTFKNTYSALKLLNWWMERCLETCSIETNISGVFGDQGYLENWGVYPEVCILSNLGGGVAPWNISQYKYLTCKNNYIMLKDIKTKQEFSLVFYHFHNIEYYDQHRVNIYVYADLKTDKTLVDFIYYPYLKEVDSVKEELKTLHGFLPLLSAHPAFRYKKEKQRKRISNIFKDNLFFARVYAASIRKIKIMKNKKKNIISF